MYVDVADDGFDDDVSTALLPNLELYFPPLVGGADNVAGLGGS